MVYKFVKLNDNILSKNPIIKSQSPKLGILAESIYIIRMEPLWAVFGPKLFNQIRKG